MTNTQIKRFVVSAEHWYTASPEYMRYRLRQLILLLSGVTSELALEDGSRSVFGNAAFCGPTHKSKKATIPI